MSSSGTREPSVSDTPAADQVEEADIESFPASDAPAWTGVTGTRTAADDESARARPGPAAPDGAGPG